MPQPTSHLQILSVMAILFLGSMIATAGGPNLMLNPDFSLGVDSMNVPLHWVSFSGVPGADFTLTTERVTVGTHALKLVDLDSNKSSGVRSHPVDAQPGNIYLAEADVYVEQGTAMFYLDFLDARGQRIEAKTANMSKTGDWYELSVEAKAPVGTESITLILYSSIPNVGTLFFDNVRLFDVTDRPIVLQERQPTDRELGFLPAEGAPVRVNPPALVWLPTPRATSYIVEYSTDPTFVAGQRHRAENVKLPLYVADHTLEPGVWYWRYWGRTDDGQLVGPSGVRSFHVADGLPELPLPPKEEWMARIPNEHPRLFLRPEDVEPLRARLNVRAVPSLFSQGHLASLIGVELPPEPISPYATGGLDIEVWRQGTQAMNPAFDTLQELSFLYLVTQKEEYGGEGKKLLLHLAAMDPSGATSYRGAPEVAMRMLYFLPRAYTWLHDTMTEAERQVVRDSVRVRGQEAYGMIKGLPFETSPYSSHPGRMLGFLGQLSIAFFDEIPEAADWLEYVVQLMFGVYPAWGAEDGGYSEGINYWRAYMNWIFDFLDALKVATGIDLYQKPFFRNTGYFALYAASVGMGHPFSDGQNQGPGAADRTVTTHLARVHQDPHLAWYVNQIGGMTPRSTFHALLYQEPMPKAVPPTDLPDSKWFRDVGWVTLHRNLSEPKDNIQFTFKGSPFGSASHSHSDQNAFVLYAYGDGLAISSGYYPWSRSPHHEQWTNQTLSKNSLLIDGRGQPIFDMNATGGILGLFHSQQYDYTAGDATRAYANADLERFTRHVIYIRPDLFLLVDDVRASKPVTVDWLLHSRFPLTWDPTDQTAYTKGRNAEMDVLLLAPNEFTATVSDRFVPPPEVDTFQKEWHLTASLTEPNEQVAIVSLLVPRKLTGEGPYIVKAQAEVDGATVRVEIEHRTGDSLTTEFITVNLPDDGHKRLASVHAVAYDEMDRLQRAFAHGTMQQATDTTTLRIDEGLSASATLDADMKHIDVTVGRAEAAAQGFPFTRATGETLVVFTPFEPETVRVNGEDTTDWTYDTIAGTVQITL